MLVGRFGDAADIALKKLYQMKSITGLLPADESPPRLRLHLSWAHTDYRHRWELSSPGIAVAPERASVRGVGQS